MRDLLNHIHIARVLSPSAGPSNDTAQVGEIIDRRGYESLTYLIQTGTLADDNATFAVLLEHSDESNMANAEAVPDSMLIGTEAAAAFQFGDDDGVRKLGYIGDKRYTQLTITPSGNGSAAPMSALAVLGHPHQMPTPTLADS